MSRAAQEQDRVDAAYRAGELAGVRSRTGIDTSQSYLKGIRDCLETLRRIARTSAEQWISQEMLEDCLGPDMVERLRHHESKAEARDVAAKLRDMGKTGCDT